MKKISLFLVLVLFSCKKEVNSDLYKTNSSLNHSTAEENFVKINKDKNSVRERFSAPEGF